MAQPFAGLEPYLVSNSLNLIVLSTEQCNFRCTYCYEDFSLGKMKPDVVLALEKFITRRAPELDQLSISWFGGEPLLAVDVIERVQAHAIELSRAYPRLDLLSSMTTNGYLLDRRQLTTLVDLGVRQFQVSFDGSREPHDRKRVRAGGGATYDRIWSNLAAAREVEGDFQIVVRLHIDRDNLAEIPRFLAEFEQTFGGDPRLVILLRPLSRLGGANDAALPVLEQDDAKRAVAVAVREIDRLGLPHFPVGDMSDICYAAAANSFVVRSDGALGKCTVALSHPDNHVGRLLDDGRVSLDDGKMNAWMRGLFSEDSLERACPMIGYAD
jgi:uncharacterized protein